MIKPIPPFSRKVFWSCESPFIMPAIPQISSSLPHFFPLIFKPAEALLSTCVKLYSSVLPLFQLALANAPILSVNCCSELIAKPYFLLPSHLTQRVPFCKVF